MEIRLDRYRVFDAVAREKSFTAAARELYISQPAVSQAITQLENEFGTQLFQRHGRTVELTREGELLAGYVRAALGILSAGEEQLSKLHTLSAGELRIGAGDTVSRWLLMPAIERFHREYPEVALRITNRTSRETLRLLNEGKIDLGFVNLPMSAEGVLFEDCLIVHDVFVAGQKYQELRGRPVSLQELTQYPLLMLESASNSRRRVDRYFLENGIPPKAALELGAHHLLLDCAEIGLGIASVVREFSMHAVERGGIFLLDVQPPVPARSVGVCYLEQVELSAAAKTFLRMVKETKR